MKISRLYLAASVASTLALMIACSSDNLPAGDGDGDTVAGDGDGDTVAGDGDGDTPAASGGNTGSGGTTATGATTGSGGTPAVDIVGEACAIPAALNEYFQPTGWMGDQTSIVFSGEDACSERAPGSPVGDCYEAVIGGGTGTEGWAGIYWQHPNQNWGDAPGCDFSSKPTITFMAKGAVGGEVVSFFASGIPDGTLPPTTLTAEWAEYSIDLSSSTDAENTWGAFGFSATTIDTQTFYIDDIRIGDDGSGLGGATGL